MLLLLFRADENLYAIDARRVTEVVPRVALRTIPHAPDYLAGLLSYRGQAVPVIDFGVLVAARPAKEALNTRMILTAFTGRDGKARRLGVVAENVSHVRNAEAGQVVSPAMCLEGAPYLGEVLRLDEGLVQLVAVDRLIPDRIQDALFGNQTEPG